MANERILFMKNDSAYFKNIFHIGDMYLDHVFFEFEYEPIIFTCTDSNNSLYLCLCSEIRYVQRWIITKILFSVIPIPDYFFPMLMVQPV